MVGPSSLCRSERFLTGQHDALRDAGCVRMYIDRASGAKTDRPELTRALERLEPGDVLVAARLDRLGRSLPHLIDVVRELNERGIDFRFLSEALDTTSAGGRLLFHIAGAFAEFERDPIRERTLMGLAAAREQGRVGGRPRAMRRRSSPRREHCWPSGSRRRRRRRRSGSACGPWRGRWRHLVSCAVW